MPRRVSLPGAAELFRTTPAENRAARQQNGPDSDDRPVETTTAEPEAPADADPADESAAKPEEAASKPVEPAEPAARPRRRSAGTGRVRHEEKITVYVSSDELLDLERARLSLRAEHRMAVDRGRIVRAALAMALGDLRDHGQESELVRRLSEQ